MFLFFIVKYFILPYEKFCTCAQGCLSEVGCSSESAMVTWLMGLVLQLLFKCKLMKNLLCLGSGHVYLLWDSAHHVINLS